MSEWQDIETAPEEQLVLVAGKPFGNRGWMLSVAACVDGEWMHDDSFGWHEFGGNGGCGIDELENATHWMPLPEPPQ
jgi:hypothetical protein